jgi:type IV pilus assembly protein PilW
MRGYKRSRKSGARLRGDRFRTMKPIHQQAGHTLLELTIAAVLGLVVIAGVVATYRAQRMAYTHAGDAQRIHDAGMNALTLIGEQIQMAGFVPADLPADIISIPLFGCTAGRPKGSDDTLTCETLAGRSDGIAVQYIGDDKSTWLSSSGKITDCPGQENGATDSLVVNRYYAKASGSTGEPELYCDGSGRSGTAQPLVEGVEQLRVRYWLAGAAQSVDAAAMGRAQWASVAAVDLCVLVRGAVLGMGGTRTRYVNCDGTQGTSTDGRARQAFWRHVALRNRQEGGA